MVRSSIDDFDVLSRLGAGAYGTVFKVRRKTDDVEYVIKSVRIVELSHKEQQNAINEVTILSQLESPFVVHYFDSFISGESLHLVMEYCNKGDVDGLLKKAEEKEKNSWPEDLIWDMGLQIIMGDQ
jgi:NIMA (never in mitosis gene a)-related kinase